MPEKLTAEEIVKKVGMSKRPGYYSGRGATTTDLNGPILDKINASIKEHHGEKASKAFVQLIENIEVLSATAFLTSLYALEANKWEYTPEVCSSTNVYPDSEGSAWATIANVMGGSMDKENDKTEYIRGSFLRKPHQGINTWMEDGKGNAYGYRK